MEPALLNSLTKLHLALHAIEQAMDHVALAGTDLGISQETRKAARALLAAKAAIEAEVAYQYKKHVGVRTAVFNTA